MVTIARERTAISRSKVSAPTKWAEEEGHISGTVYDWGCGKGMDSKWLRSMDYQVISHDPYHLPENDPDSVDFSNVDTIICNYVLNVIDEQAERESLLKKIASKGVGTVIISVRCDVDVNAKKNGWKQYGDGYCTSHNTFQKNYDMNDVKEMGKLFGSIKDIRHKNGGITVVF